MTGFQKFIKYAAIAFGIYLSIIIVFTILGVFSEFVKVSRNEVIEDDEYYDSFEDDEFNDILKDYGTNL